MKISVFDDHDHARCIACSIETAEARAASEGLRLTPTRRRVLEILLEEHRALGAYDILERLNAEGKRAQPPTAYRALEFLTRAGLAHRVERLNGYVACTAPESPHAPVFMICRKCRAVAEAASDAAGAAIAATADAVDFSLEACVIEVEGLCGECARQGAV
ncbi:MAG: Fur family transcriptional regulator [Pseudomonadota bacterium]